MNAKEAYQLSIDSVDEVYSRVIKDIKSQAKLGEFRTYSLINKDLSAHYNGVLDRLKSDGYEIAELEIFERGMRFQISWINAI